MAAHFKKFRARSVESRAQWEMRRKKQPRPVLTAHCRGDNKQSTVSPTSFQTVHRTPATDRRALTWWRETKTGRGCNHVRVDTKARTGETTKMTKRNPFLTNVNDRCFLTNHSFSTFPFPLTPRLKKSLKYTMLYLAYFLPAPKVEQTSCFLKASPK